MKWKNRRLTESTLRRLSMTVVWKFFIGDSRELNREKSFLSFSPSILRCGNSIMIMAEDDDDKCLLIHSPSSSSSDDDDRVQRSTGGDKFCQATVTAFGN